MKFILAVAVKISERGQITIPQKLCDGFGMHHNVEVEISPAAEGLLIRKRTEAEHPVGRVFISPGPRIRTRPADHRYRRLCRGNQRPMITAVDTNVLLDLFPADDRPGNASKAHMMSADGAGALIASEVV